VQNSAELHNFTTGTEQGIASDCEVPTFIGTREIYGDLGDIEVNDGVQRVLTEIKRHQSSLNKKQLDDIQGVGNSVEQHHSPNREPSKYQNSLQQVEDGPSMSLAYGSDMTFLAVGEKVGAEMALNKEQFIAFMCVMEALDEHERKSQSAIQHLQYLGGEGGTGKSTVIKAIYTVFRSLEQASAIILTAASGAAAAEIGGITIYSAVKLGVGQTQKFPQENGSIQYRWMTRKMLVIDEISMLGCQDFYNVNLQLQRFRESPQPFGGLPVVLLVGDFLQFGPVLAKSILIESDQPQLNPTKIKANEEAKALFKQVTHVILLQQQVRAACDPALRSLLRRVRKGEQTLEDLEDLNTRVIDLTEIQIKDDLHIITPVNRHRWNINLHAALRWASLKKRVTTIFISKHRWEDRNVTAALIQKVCSNGDESTCPIPGIFPYVEGMPVCLNKNMLSGLHAANGALYEAVGIVPDPKAYIWSQSEGVRIHVGPPLGIILKSQTTKGYSFPHIPENTIFISPESTSLKKKDANGNSLFGACKRIGLPCTPAFAITDYKSQGKTMEQVVLGLYGRYPGNKCSFTSFYVQLSRCKSLNGIRLLRPLDHDEFFSIKPSKGMETAMAYLQEQSAATLRKWETTRPYT
jgi:hypothetical protein